MPAALRRQLDYLAERSTFYRRRLDGVRVRGLADLQAVPFTTKEELRAGQRARAWPRSAATSRRRGTSPSPTPSG